MSQALYRKWRPHLWDEVIGQEHVVRTLKNAIQAGRVGHAYLFAGPRGTGKTTTARLLAKAVNCLNPDSGSRPCDVCEHCTAVNEGRFLDLIEIDAASNTSVDDVRELRDKINFSPSQGQFKIYIIDEVHMLSTAAFNALLKTLEEPPAHAIFILATTESHKIPATVLSRCQRHEFRRIPVNDIVRNLQGLCQKEGLPAEPEALTLIARQATGSMRDAISLLDQLASTGETISLGLAQSVLGTATSQVVIELTDALVNRQAAAGMDAIHRALDSGTDPRQFARQVVEYLRSVLLVKVGSASQVDATAELRAQIARHATSFDLAALLETVRLFNDAAADKTTSGWQPSLLLELALAQAVEGPQLRADAPVAAAQPAPSIQLPQPRAAEPEPRPAGPAPFTPRPAETTPKPAASTSPAPDPDPASTAAEPTPAAPSPSGGAISFNDIVKNWARIRALVKKKHSQTEALLNSCKPAGVKDGALLIAFSTEVLKEKMEAGSNLQLTRSAIQQVLGVDVPVRCVVSSAKGGGLPADLEIDGDGMVGTALGLGAEIVHKD